jgi:hypothetical protein
MHLANIFELGEPDLTSGAEKGLPYFLSTSKLPTVKMSTFHFSTSKCRHQPNLTHPTPRGSVRMGQIKSTFSAILSTF